MDELIRKNRELVYKGTIINLYKDTVCDNEGNTYDYDFISHKGAAAVIPITDDKKIIMVKQYRNALDRFTLEIPAGGLNNIEEPMYECAKRELEEETGYASNELEHLITLRTTIAFCNEKIEVFVANNLKKTKQHLDEGEYIDCIIYSIEELMDMIYKDIIQDAKTVAALSCYYNKYCVKHN